MIDKIVVAQMALLVIFSMNFVVAEETSIVTKPALKPGDGCKPSRPKAGNPEGDIVKRIQPIGISGAVDVTENPLAMAKEGGGCTKEITLPKALVQKKIVPNGSSAQGIGSGMTVGEPKGEPKGGNPHKIDDWKALLNSAQGSAFQVPYKVNTGLLSSAESIKKHPNGVPDCVVTGCGPKGGDDSGVVPPEMASMSEPQKRSQGLDVWLLDNVLNANNFKIDQEHQIKTDSTQSR